jgi:MerR family transcriptional regulator, mercuric resistance operon regulatory protein
VAEKAGVNIQTLRYYERRGLLARPKRLDSGYRAYAPETVDSVRFIKRAQELGFALSEIATLLDLSKGGPSNCDRAQALAKSKIAELDRKIASLNAMRESLQRLASTCRLPRKERDCPLIQSMAAQSASRWLAINDED